MIEYYLVSYFHHIFSVLGDIYLTKDDIDNAKAKYNFVLKNYPNNSVSSIVLQILENME